MSKLSNRIRKLIFALAGILVCGAFYFLPAPDSLDACATAVGSTGITAMRVLGAILLAIIWWIGEVLPNWMTAISMLLLWVVLGRIPFTSAFSAYSGSTVWLVIGAFCLAATVTKTGLFNRITLGLFRVFSPAFSQQILAMLLVGTLCAPLIPSAAAKAVLGATLAQKSADAMCYPPHSKERCGLFMAAFIGFCITTPAFMSGSVFTYSLLGVLSDEARTNVSWLSWLVAMLPWLLILLATSYVFICLTATPKKGTYSITRGYAKEEFAKLGKMSSAEKKSALLLAAAVLLWISENILKIDACATAMGVTVLCFALKLLDNKEISTAVPWALVLHIGGVVALGSILPIVGLDKWIQGLMTPVFENVATPVTAILTIFLLVLLARVVMVSQNAVVVMMVALLPPLLSAAGMGEWAIGLVVLATETCWILPFQNTVFISALSCTEGTLAHKQTIKYSLWYELFSLLAFLISIRYWRFLGLIG